MPTYDYGCVNCGYRWELEQRITAPPALLCPKCTQSTAKRLISAPVAALLVGGRWSHDNYGLKGR